MAKIVEHGKYWREDVQKAYNNARVKCHECENTILISSYVIYIKNDVEVHCTCGCRFFPEVSDIVKEDEI